MRQVVSIALLSVVAGSAWAQASAPAGASEFPAGAQPIAADALRDRVSGKVFRVAVASGAVWRLQFQGTGFYYINVGSFSDSGKWRVEDSSLCFEPQRTKAGCNLTRLVGETIHFRRDSGEVVKLEPQ